MSLVAQQWALSRVRRLRDVYALSVLLALADLASDEGLAVLSRKQLGARAMLSQNRLRVALDDLVAAGFVEEVVSVQSSRRRRFRLLPEAGR